MKDFCKVLLFLTFLLLVGSSCKKTENDVLLEQAFSLPVGEKEIALVNPPAEASTPVPGPRGTFLYNGKPYPIYDLLFEHEEELEFDVDSISRLDWLQRVDFVVRISNSFPVVGYLQVYLLNQNKQTIGLMFEKEQTFGAGTLDDHLGVQNIHVSVHEAMIAGENLKNLKATKYLRYVFKLETWRKDGKQLSFTSNSNVKVNLAIRLFYKYNINQM